MAEKTYLSVREAAAFCGMSVSWMNKARMRSGVGPEFNKVGARRVVYSIEALQSFMSESRRSSTVEAREAAKSKETAA